MTSSTSTALDATTNGAVGTPAQDSRADIAMSVLNNTISVVKHIQNVIPFDIAKGVLSSVTDILTTVKDFVKNRDDFLDLVQQCRRIAGILEQAQSGPSVSDAAVTNVISNLRSSVESIQITVTNKTQDSGGKRLFNVVIDKENVAGWQKQLDSSLQFFIAEMALATSNALAIRNMAETLTAGEAVPDALPSAPTVFFGRSELMDQVSLALLECEHVALIGSGGMGKSSIAAAVLRSDGILKRFNDRRYFVRFDDINPAQITPATFLQRVSRALGIKSSEVEPHTLISRHLSSSETLVVLDNGESFQDSSSGDPQGRIANAVIDFSNIPGVAILLTTRTATIPFACRRINVPTLEEKNACAVFMKIYPNFADPSVLPKLLTTLDFHPLSINLLAHAAVQNNSSPEDLLKSWEQLKARLLEQGSGKFQSLAATIGLSLKSPAISSLGDAALRLLQTIAFLPQGIYEEHMSEVIPRVPRPSLEKAVSVLLSHSLIYREGGFLTMLAPIRLHIAGPDNAGIFPVASTVLADVRQCYFSRVQRHMDNIDWLKIEDGNAEGIIAAVVAGSTLDKSIRKFCANVTLPFIQFLTMQKPRATILRAVILDLPELPDRKGNFLKVLWQEFRDGMNIASKRLCIIFLANLAISAGQMQEAMELGTIARGLYQKHGIENAPLESRYMRAIEEGLGRTQLDIGKIDDAESTVKRALSTSLTIRLKSDISIELGLTLAYLAILLLKGRDDEARLLLAKAKKDIKKLGPIVKAEPMYAGLWYMQLCFEDKEDIEEVRNACEDVINTDKISYSEDFKTSITIMAIEVALRQNDIERAKQNVKRAVELTSKMKPKPLSVLASFTLLVTNDFKEARSLINRAIADASIHGIALLSMSCLYIAAGIEMHAGEYTAARDLYQKIIEDGVVLSEMPWRARSTRALGEIALLDGDADGARAKFEEVASLCKTMGVPPKNLYRDSLFKSLDKDKFIGWQQFLDTLSTEA